MCLLGVETKAKSNTIGQQGRGLVERDVWGKLVLKNKVSKATSYSAGVLKLSITQKKSYAMLKMKASTLCYQVSSSFTSYKMKML